MTTTPPNLNDYKIEIIEGINDVPEPPNYEDNGKGCNGAYFIDKFHGALDSLSGYFGDLTGQYALYPEKVLPFVPEDPGVLTYGTYNFTADDFGRTLTADPNLNSGYTLAVTIPSGLVVTPGLQTYFGLKGGCRFSVSAGVGVTLYKFDNDAYLEPGQVWVLLCTGTDSYSLYRVSTPKTVATYGSTYIELPKVEAVPLFTAPANTLIKSLLGLKLDEGSLTMSLQIDGVNVTGLTNLSVTTAAQNVNATALNNVAVGARASLNITDISTPIVPRQLEFTLSAEVG